MISPRPGRFKRLPLGVTDKQQPRSANGIVWADGSTDYADIDEEDLRRMLECDAAFHSAGIDPADLPKFVEEARARSDKLWAYERLFLDVGIYAADLPKFIEAVRKLFAAGTHSAGYPGAETWYIPLDNSPGTYTVLKAAAACLPENRNEKA